MRRQAYLLAAGRGRRAGGPKAWQDAGGRALLERQLEFLLGRFEPEDVAVTIQQPWRGRCLALHPGVRWVSHDPEDSALSALQALLKAAPPRGWTFLHHVDMPVWEEGVFEALESRCAAAAAEALVPTFGGKGGHPVVLSAVLAPALAGLDAENGRLDLFLRSRRIETVEVPYGCVLENWNFGHGRSA